MRAEEKIFKKIFLTIFFILSSTVLSNFVAACANPSFYDQDGWYVNSFGGLLEIDARSFTSGWMDYTLYVKNNDNNYVLVSIKPSNSIKNYIKTESVRIAPYSIEVMHLQVWADGTNDPYASGVLNVRFNCDNDMGQFIFPFLNVQVTGKGNNPPPDSSCDSDIDGCYVPGLYRSYYCTDNNPQPQYNTMCIKSCCQAYGGKDAFCSYDKHSCIAPRFFPEPTEGSIAFICKSKNCKTAGEKNVITLFNYLGWSVTNKTSKEWTAEELDQHDIIVCSEPSACKADFNSAVYNEHFLKKKPFLEITSSNSAFAALNFDYINKSSGTNKRDKILITSNDPILNGYTGLIEVVAGSRSVKGIKDNYLTSKVEDLANVGDPNKKGGVAASAFFKVNEAVDHGRYAFVGFFSDATVGDITYEGETLIRNTLKWLKCGETCFGGTNPTFNVEGSVAYICGNNKCNAKNDIGIIKWLRESGYYTEGMPQKSWNSSTLNGYDLILCSSSKACSFTNTNDIFSEHVSNGMGFLEMPDSARVYAGNVFGYTNAKKVVSKSSTDIISTNTLIAPLGSVNVLNKKANTYGISSNDIIFANSLAKVVTYDASTILTSDTSGSKGRYAYVGWAGSKFYYLSDQGKEILLKVLNWVSCGNMAGC